MDKADIPFLSATQLSRLIESKEVSPVEATEAYLERIDGLDHNFNSFLTVCREEALREAHQAEGAILQGKYLGPMHGIPIAVKDQMWTKGVRSTGGSRILADFIPDEDATVIANLKRCGAILLGKTNLYEFAAGLPHVFGTPRNPWDLEMSTGGSSSGSGAAVAAFLCSTSLGEDTAGSIRWPSAWCGIVGLRPSWGRVSRYGVLPCKWSMDAVGPMSRTVEDAAITLAAIAGYDPKDSYSWNTPVPDYRQALKGDISSMRIGVITEHASSESVDPDTRDAFLKATSVLAELGASVAEVSIPLAAHGHVINAGLRAEVPTNYWEWVKHRLQDCTHGNRIGLLTGSIIPSDTYYKALKLRSLLRQQILGVLETYDVLVSPTMGTAARKNDGDHAGADRGGVSGPPAPDLLTYTFALASAPAISLPCGLSSEGLPIGLQIGGRPGDEEAVLRVAYAYEQNTPWHNLRPPAA